MITSQELSQSYNFSGEWYSSVGTQVYKNAEIRLLDFTIVDGYVRVNLFKTIWENIKQSLIVLISVPSKVFELGQFSPILTKLVKSLHQTYYLRLKLG